NLAWKLAAVVKGQAPESLLDSYERRLQERALARIPVPHRFPNDAQLPRKRAERGQGWGRAGWRPPALGAAARRRQLRPAGANRLAGTRLWRGRGRLGGVVPPVPASAARVRLAAGARQSRPGPKRGLPAAAGYAKSGTDGQQTQMESAQGGAPGRDTRGGARRIHRARLCGGQARRGGPAGGHRQGHALPLLRHEGRVVSGRESAASPGAAGDWREPGFPRPGPHLARQRGGARAGAANRRNCRGAGARRGTQPARPRHPARRNGAAGDAGGSWCFVSWGSTALSHAWLAARALPAPPLCGGGRGATQVARSAAVTPAK
nr:hypothetical protein [Tanacetum cinerariifolium]